MINKLYKTVSQIVELIPGNSIDKIITHDKLEFIPKDKLKIVLCGMTGAGKTSILNMLLGVKLFEQNLCEHTTKIPVFVENSNGPKTILSQIDIMGTESPCLELNLQLPSYDDARLEEQLEHYLTNATKDNAVFKGLREKLSINNNDNFYAQRLRIASNNIPNNAVIIDLPGFESYDFDDCGNKEATIAAQFTREILSCADIVIYISHYNNTKHSGSRFISDQFNNAVQYILVTSHCDNFNNPGANRRHLNEGSKELCHFVETTKYLIERFGELNSESETGTLLKKIPAAIEYDRKQFVAHCRIENMRNWAAERTEHFPHAVQQHYTICSQLDNCEWNHKREDIQTESLRHSAQLILWMKNLSISKKGRNPLVNFKVLQQEIYKYDHERLQPYIRKLVNKLKLAKDSVYRLSRKLEDEQEEQSKLVADQKNNLKKITCLQNRAQIETENLKKAVEQYSYKINSFFTYYFQDSEESLWKNIILEVKNLVYRHLELWCSDEEISFIAPKDLKIKATNQYELLLAKVIEFMEAVLREHNQTIKNSLILLGDEVKKTIKDKSNAEAELECLEVQRLNIIKGKATLLLKFDKILNFYKKN